MRTYSELITFPTFKERYDYLRLGGAADAGQGDALHLVAAAVESAGLGLDLHLAVAQLKSRCHEWFTSFVL